MALEIIRAIKETEEKAEEIKKKAAVDAKEEIKQYELQNEDYFEKKVSEAKLEAARILSEYEAQAEIERQHMQAGSLSETGRLEANAQKNMDAAVRFILGRL
jgi:V/A-type H+-transporting ATPase subunit G/H